MRSFRMSVFGLLMLGTIAATGCGGSAEEGTPKAGTTSGSTSATSSSANENLPDDAPLPEIKPPNPFPVVVLRTSAGEIHVKLNAEKAPRTVQNFLNYVDNAQYDQTIFHQVEAGYVILGGTYTTEMNEREGRYPIANEATNGLKNIRGTISMARQFDVIDSSTCQFFINLNDNPGLDHQGEKPEEYGFCVFGDVVGGMEVIDKIAQAQVRDTEKFQKLPVKPIVIESARRLDATSSR
jgi:peptidyl-prolyl cis-trans isomerase A (cyclophilin A)